MSTVNRRCLEPRTARDYETRLGAQALAIQVLAFSSVFGHDLEVWTERVPGGGWGVRSALVGGLPPSTPAL
jgi:hypothetical protein